MTEIEMDKYFVNENCQLRDINMHNIFVLRDQLTNYLNMEIQGLCLYLCFAHYKNTLGRIWRICNWRNRFQRQCCKKNHYMEVKFPC